jgi:hypothetical protein
MAIIAQFSFDVPFGKKAEIMALTAKWQTLAQELGFPKGQRLVGSIGVPESRFVEQYRFESLAALEAVWAKLNHPRMPEFQNAMAPLVVPGSHRWEIYRIIEE